MNWYATVIGVVARGNRFLPQEILLGTLAENLEPLREDAQVEKLTTLLSAARNKQQKPVWRIETAYWKNTLRKFFVDEKRIKITRVVDYYHA